MESEGSELPHWSETLTPQQEPALAHWAEPKTVGKSEHQRCHAESQRFAWPTDGQLQNCQELFFSVFAIPGIFSAWVDLTDYVEKWCDPLEFPFAIRCGVFISIYCHCF